ncbi:hypothetical protein BC938DRAFT_471515 [Jimgerdemannia flammicorona]|uniref:Uncharacterized protein n=1 Tax=Jimgerdemannia flammicorona TaxID=994334 RepID=A0A433Q7Z1_9FUNG|nr:hypothetical protein BC938DRAFT_471515 [Jimgerdemannia flammicorona]
MVVLCHASVTCPLGQLDPTSADSLFRYLLSPQLNTMNDAPDSEAARKEKLLAAKKKLQKFQKNKSSADAPSSADSLKPRKSSVTSGASTDGSRPKRRGSVASSVASDVSSTAPSEKKNAKNPDEKESKILYPQGAFAAGKPSNSVSPIVSPVASPPTSPPPHHVNLPPASDLFASDSTSHPIFSMAADFTRSASSLFDGIVSSNSHDDHAPTIEAQRQTIATLSEEKQALSAEVQRLMGLVNRYKSNESLLAEGTNLMSAWTTQNGVLEEKTETISLLEIQLRDLRIENQELSNSHASTSNKAESMEFELSSIRQSLARAKQTAIEKEEQAAQALAARAQAEERFAAADARRADLETEKTMLRETLERSRLEGDETRAMLVAASAEAKARDVAVAEASAEKERLAAELEQARVEEARMKKQLKGVTEKMERLGGENKALLVQVDGLRDTVVAETAEKERLVKELEGLKAAFVEVQTQMEGELEAARRKGGEEVQELQTRLDLNRAELEALSVRLVDVVQGGAEVVPLAEHDVVRHEIELVRGELAVERARSQDLERRLEALRSGFDELNGRLAGVLGVVGCLIWEVWRAQVILTLILTLSLIVWSHAAEYDRERRQILGQTRSALDRLQKRYITNGGQGSSVRSSISNVTAVLTGGSSRPSFSADRLASRRASTLSQERRPHFHEFHDVPRSQRWGRLIDVTPHGTTNGNNFLERAAAAPLLRNVHNNREDFCCKGTLLFAACRLGPAAPRSPPWQSYQPLHFLGLDQVYLEDTVCKKGSDILGLVMRTWHDFQSEQPEVYSDNEDAPVRGVVGIVAGLLGSSAFLNPGSLLHQTATADLANLALFTGPPQACHHLVASRQGAAIRTRRRPRRR